MRGHHPICAYSLRERGSVLDEVDEDRVGFAP